MKKILLLLIGGLLLACTCSVPSLSLSTPTRTSPSQDDPPGQSFEANLSVVRLSPRDGDLTDQLHAEAPKAAALGQHMFVEFDAEW